uniref:Uncharacterized protein n=2 Tax=Enterobacteriaceae TaxID=543 RepID=S4WTS8_ECOLX|nr:hypothetical protein pkp53il_00470 [Klebsiella pneumoniae]AGP03447.1 hypothetical protein pec386IL_00335 [Escherichia coli]
MTGQLRYRRTWLAADASRQAPARRAKPGGQAERGGRRPEAGGVSGRCPRKRGETGTGSMRSTAERPRRGNARSLPLFISRSI